MKRTLLWLAALAACDEHRSVTVLLGPDDHTLTAGFTCKDERGDLLLDRTRTGDELTFQLVFDTFDLGPTQLGCRGEELFQTCVDHTCTRISRFCMQVHVPTTGPAAVLAALHAQLGDHELLADAPGDPIVVRAVATQEPCDAIGDAPLDASQAVGCAYSCPVILDDLHGSLGLALDTLDDQCSAEVHACAALARN
ncbi:MAG TPA: hypothetical protein VFP84_24945 [Kofleriaceae bacterium]|nr:hypothetical protein [Kofleriaceae bacterium]